MKIRINHKLSKDALVRRKEVMAIETAVLACHPLCTPAFSFVISETWFDSFEECLFVGLKYQAGGQEQ